MQSTIVVRALHVVVVVWFLRVLQLLERADSLDCMLAAPARLGPRLRTKERLVEEL
jgi:hypothetical protein